MLLALVWLGLPAALLTGAAQAAGASLLCEHPAVFVLIAAQLVFVHAFLVRARRAGREPFALPVLIGLYWVSLGIPLTLAYIWLRLDLGLDATLLVLLKYAANDIVSAVFAELLLVLVALYRRRPASLSSRHLLFVLFSVGSLLPACTLTFIGTRDLQYRLETELAQRLQLFGAAAEEVLALEAARAPIELDLERLSERLETRLAKRLPEAAVPSVQALPLATGADDQARPFAQRGGLQLVNSSGEPPSDLRDWRQVRYRLILPLQDLPSTTGLRIEVSSVPLIAKVHAWLRLWLALLLGWAAIAIVSACWLSGWLMKLAEDLIQTAGSLSVHVDSGQPIPSLPPSWLKEQVQAARALIAIGERLKKSFSALADERDQQREQRALSDLHAETLDELITADTDEHLIATHLCQRISRLLPAHQCTLVMSKPDGEFEVLAAPNLDEQGIARLNARLADRSNVCVHRNTACAYHQAFKVAGVSTEADAEAETEADSDTEAEDVTETLRQRLEAGEEGAGTCWCQPIPGYNGRILGVISLTAPQASTPDRFATTLLEHAASLAATVLSGMRLRRDHQVMLDALSQAETGIVIAERREDGDHPISFVSHGFENLTGYSADEVVGRDCRFLQGSDCDQPGRHELRAALAEGRSCTATLRNYRKDGSVYWNSVSITPVTDGQGRISHYIGIQRNDTERLKAMEQLSANEARLRELTETIGEVFWVFDLEQDRLTYVSRAFEAIWERPVAAVYDDLNAWLESIHPADRERMSHRRLELSAGSGREMIEYRILTPNGASKWIADRRFLIRDANRHPCRVIGVAADITDRKAAEQALKEQRLRLEQIIEGTQIATWEWNVETDETHFNERWAEMLGYQLAELQPTTRLTFFERLHPDDHRETQRRLQAHLNDEVAQYECEFRMRHKDGHWVWIQNAGRVVERSPDGGALRLIGLHLEVTERKQAELQLVARERLERELVALTTAFVGSTDEQFSDLIQTALAKVGELTGADRAYLFQVDSGTDCFSNSHEWVAPGIEAMISSLQGIPTEDFGPGRGLLAAAKPVVVPRVTELGEEWRTLRKELEREQIQSLILVPLIDEQCLVGFVGLDAVRQQREWTEPELHLLSGLAAALVGALQRERVLAELRTSTERYDALALQSRMWTWEIDNAGIYTYVNPVAETLLGYPPEALIGEKAFYDLIPEPERAGVKAQGLALIQQRQPWLDFQCPLLCADNRRLWVSVDGQPIVDADGGLLGYRGSTLDMTDVQHAENQRRAAEQALQRYSEDLEHLVDLSNRGLEVTEEATALLQIANDALGMTIAETGCREPKAAYQRLVRLPASATEPSALAARSVTEALFAEPAELSDQPRLISGEALPKPVRAQGYRSMILLVSRWPNEAPPSRWLLTQLWSEQPRADLSGAERELLRFIGQRIATILHEAELARDLVSAKERETIGHLASGVAHDFNNVLAVLDANLYFLRSFIQPSEPDAESTQVLDEMSSVLGQAKVITSGMLALSRAGGVPMHPTPLEPPLRELSEILRMMLPESIDWQLKVEPGLTANTNGGFLQAALLNLALNGRDAMADGGQLSVTARREHWQGQPMLMVGDLNPGDYAIIHVNDTGGGIPPAVLNRMFEPLFSTKTQQRGHGLGLFMVREFVLHSGAGLAVRSTLGRGTHMQFLLPLAETD